MSIFIGFLKYIIELFFSITGDYGVAIVIVTVLVRTLLVPLDIRQRRQMEKQKEISKKIDVIKSKYKKNQKQMEKEVQRVYQENGTGVGSCLVSVLQLPVMLGLYNAIRMISAAACATVLLPWISSLLVRDQLFLMPIATLIVQLLPQTYPYMRFFKELELQKQPVGSIAAILLVNSLYLFVIPSGLGLYCFTSGLFQTIEQLIFNIIEIQKRRVQHASC